MAVTPLLIDQIEKFQWLELSTAHGLSCGVLSFHVACDTYPQKWFEDSQPDNLIKFTNTVP